MNSLAVFGMVFCGLIAGAMLLYCAKSQHSENSQLERLRETAAYKQLKRDLSALNRHDIDQVRIECSGITVTSVCPAHIVLRFSFKQNGNSLRNDTFAKLYAELIAQDFPFLTERAAYKVRAYKVYRANGKAERAYAFLMRRGYKDYLLYQRNQAEVRLY